MRIVLDLQGCQSASRPRGIGRYSLALAKAIAKNAGNHDIWILISDLFPDTIDPLIKEFEGVIPVERIKVFSAPGPVAEGDPANFSRARIAELIREHAIVELQADIVHISSLFEGYVDNAITSIGRLGCHVPTVVTLYDLIPLLNQKDFFSDSNYKFSYLRKVDSLMQADLLLAISESAGKEATLELNIPPGKIINIDAGVDDRFYPEELASTDSIDVLGRHGLLRPFLFYIGAIEPRKNFKALIQAYAMLPGHIRSAYQLLIVAQGTDAARADLQQFAISAGLAANDVVISSFVSDDDLVSLYRLCHLFVFPSLHEGFGLPVLEAMSCGAAVIGSNSSSIPEVIGREDALFDPTSTESISSKILQGLVDETFLISLRRHGLIQVKKFSWDISAKRALSAFESLLAVCSDKIMEPTYQTLISAIVEEDAAQSDDELARASDAIARNVSPYSRWIIQNERNLKRAAWVGGVSGPVISILVVATRSSFARVALTLQSLQAQQNARWQFVVAGIALEETDRRSIEALVEYLGEKAAVLVLDSVTRGQALRLLVEEAGGDYVTVIEPGDVFSQDALGIIGKRLYEDPDIDILYGDEDIFVNGLRTAPKFKPEWSPELLLAYNYFGRPTVIRKTRIVEAGSFSRDFERAAEWDLYLRVTQEYTKLVSTPRIRRIARVLCHCHHLSGSEPPRPHQQESADFRKALARHWQRVGIEATVITKANGTQQFSWEISEPPLVSVIIPSKNRSELISVCLDGLMTKTDYSRIEIIVVDNGSTEPSALQLYEKAKQRGVRIVEFNEPFNYSRACNRGAQVANGELLLFLNNDIEVIHPDWLSEMVRFSLLQGVGIVGAKLIYPDGLIQHAGVVLGFSDICGHVFMRAGKTVESAIGTPSITRNWMAITGACQLVRRDVFDRIGGFDERLAMAASDVILCLSAWRAGYRTVYAADAELIHHEGVSRGHTNPESDMAMAAAIIRALGIDDDPYFHPALSPTSFVPVYRSINEPSIGENLKLHIERRVRGKTVRLIAPINDDQMLVDVVGKKRSIFLWDPDAPSPKIDLQGAVRLMVDLLRRRPDISERFPSSLSSGANGGFALWLKNEALAQFGFDEDAASSVDAAFNADLSNQVRQLIAVGGCNLEEGLYLHSPSTAWRGLLKTLFELVAEGKLSKEVAWWFLMQSSEPKVKGNIGGTGQAISQHASEKSHSSRTMLILFAQDEISLRRVIQTVAEVAEELRSLDTGILILQHLPGSWAEDIVRNSVIWGNNSQLSIEFVTTKSNLDSPLALNEALLQARAANAGVLILMDGAVIPQGALIEMMTVADSDPMIGVVCSPAEASEREVEGDSAKAEKGLLSVAEVFELPCDLLPRMSYGALTTGSCLYIKPQMFVEFGVLDPAYVTLRGSLNEFAMRCNLRGYRVAVANRALVHLQAGWSGRPISKANLEQDSEFLSSSYPHSQRAIQRLDESAESKAQRLLAGLIPNNAGQRRLLFESSHLACVFNGTSQVTTNLLRSFVDQFSDQYECWVSCSIESFRFHGLDQIQRLRYAGEFDKAKKTAPYFAVMRLAQPFSIADLVTVGSLAPLSGFLVLDTIALDCHQLDQADLHTLWNYMVRTVTSLGYISNYSAGQFNRRFFIPDDVMQSTILLSTNPTDYIEPGSVAKNDGYLLLVGNEYSHKHLHETIDLFRQRSNRPPLVVLGLGIENEAGITGYPSGGLDDSFVESLYRNANVVVFPSHYEGFGLPIMHALGHKKPVVARAIPVFDEIRIVAPGGKNIHLYGSSDEIVEAALAQPSWNDVPADGTKTQTWDCAARQLEALLTKSEARLSFYNLLNRVFTLNFCVQIAIDNK